jgi:hypothetical protein
MLNLNRTAVGLSRPSTASLAAKTWMPGSRPSAQASFAQYLRSISRALRAGTVGHRGIRLAAPGCILIISDVRLSLNSNTKADIVVGQRRVKSGGGDE